MEFYTEGNIFRNDNWYLVLKYSLKYKEEKIEKISFNFENAIDYTKVNNIYIIINESYPNFKDKNLKNILLNYLVQDLKNTKIEKYKSNWSKNYSTQGAELNLFCANENLFKDFQELDLLKFINKHNCWIKKFENKKKIFIHSYEEEMFNRGRYKSFFDETYFLNSLKAYNLKTCNGIMEGICDQEVLDKIFPKIKKYKESKLTIFLTLNNHVPLIVLKDRSECSQYPLNQHDQFCSLYNNQTILNKSINSFLKTLDKNDILIFFSDTPPLFSLRDRKYFEDYVDVFFFIKN